MTSFDKEGSLGKLFSVPPNTESSNNENANIKQELFNYCLFTTRGNSIQK